MFLDQCRAAFLIGDQSILKIMRDLRLNLNR